MEVVNGLCFKLVYSDWYIRNGSRHPLGNGMHPVLSQYVKNIHKNNINFDYYKLQDGIEERIFKFDHSEFIRFFQRNYPQNIVSENQILDDNFIYLFPIEIRSTLGSLNDLNTFPLEGQIYQYYFKDTLTDTILKHLKSGKLKLLINIIHDPLYDENNIRKFEIQMNTLGICGDNIIFLGGSKFEEYYEKYPDSRVKIYNGHLFIKGYVDQIKEFPCVGNLGYMCELVEEVDLNPNVFRNKKFLSANRSMDKIQRVIMAYFAVKYDLLKDGNFTFIQPIEQNRLKEYIRKYYKDSNDNIENITKKIIEIIPYELDTDTLEANKKMHFGSKNNKKDWYINSYIHLVTETFFGPNVFLSEKIFKPMSNLQPFIVFGDYKTLAELKKLGFKTFSPFIDESYDEEKNPNKRIELLEKEIIKLSNMKIEEIHNWYYSIIDILIFNKKHLMTFENYECFEPILEKIKLDYENEKLWNLQEKKLL